MSALVTREDWGRISVLCLNHPPANGYSYAMHRQLDQHVLDLRMDVDIDVVVLRGAGDRFFCAGADITYLQGLSPEEKYAFCLHANETLLRIENTPKLFIAALNGHCVGGGLEMAMACDLRIGRASGEKARLVGLPEVHLGVLPGTGGTQRLTRLVGRAAALSMMLHGENFSVEEALGLGLVHRVLPDQDWWRQVSAFAESFCRPHRSADAVGMIKRAVLGGADLPLESGLALERELQQRLFQGPDAREGLLAFADKRRPNFAPYRKIEPLPVHTVSGVASEHTEEAPRTATEPAANTWVPDAPIGDEVLNLLSREVVEKWRVVPVRLRGGALLVATADPRNVVAQEALRDVTGLDITLVPASELDVAVAIHRYYRA